MSSSPFVTGALGGGLGALVLQPLDLVKSRLQASAACSATRPAVSPFALARRITAEEGVAGLWKGTGPSATRFCVGAGLYFGFLDGLFGMAGGRDGLSPLANFFCGATARGAASTIMLPVTVVKTRFESMPHHSYRSTLSAVAEIGRVERLGGLYSGLGATLLRDVPFSGLYFVLYESLRRGYQKLSLADVAPSAAETFGLGLAAGAGATVVTQPFDVIKTRLQLPRSFLASTSVTAPAAAGGTGLFAGAEIAAGIYRTEGVRGLFRGIGLRVLKRPISQAIVWTVFEFTTRRE